MTAYEFILHNIDKTTKSGKELTEGWTPLIELPYPYTTPCADGMFQEMYYWDTYFTHKCLLSLGKAEQVLNNVKNFVFLLEKYGKILNGNRMHYLSRSQPAFFGLMLSDLREARPDLLPLEQAFGWLEKEYSFWMNNRFCENGLNRYGADVTDEEALGNVGYYKGLTMDGYVERTGIALENTAKNCRDVIAECESGWDFSPRFESQGARFNPVDLNGLLYADEVLLSKWAEELGDKKTCEKYETASKVRKEKMLALMKKEGIYYDYGFEKGACSKVISCAGFFPYFVGMDRDTEGFLKTLSYLERDHGVVACTTDKRIYQWAEPNGWAPLHYIAVASAKRLGLEDVAKRIADKYLAVTDEIFEKTQRLWEKFNAETGTLEVASEYGTPEMLGWSAGVYIAFSDYRKSGYKNLI